MVYEDIEPSSHNKSFQLYCLASLLERYDLKTLKFNYVPGCVVR